MKLKEWREKSGLSQEKLAECVGVHENTIRKWEKEYREPRASDIAKLAAALNISELELLTGPEPGTREFKLILDKEGELDMNVINISGNAPEQKVLIVSKDRLAVSTNLKTAGMDKETAKKTLWEEFCAVFDDAWAQQEKWQATA